MDELPKGPYKAYDLMTNEFLGGYANPDAAHVKNLDRAVTVIYRPTKKRVKKEFPYNA